MHSDLYVPERSQYQFFRRAFASITFVLCLAGVFGMAGNLNGPAAAKGSAQNAPPAGATASLTTTTSPTPTLTSTPGCQPQWSATYTRNRLPGDTWFRGIDALAANDVWAVGNYLSLNGSPAARTVVQRWNGHTWSVIPSPNVDESAHLLTSVSARADDDVWAVGSYGDTMSAHTLTLHWDGNAFSIVPSPTVGSDPNYLLGVAAVASNDVWAVGYTGWSFSRTLIEHWDGAQWSVVPSPNTGDRSALFAVAAISANDIWAVGSSGFQPDERTFTVHWDGTAWSIVDSPNVGSDGNWLSGVSASSTNDVWAVGTQVDISGPSSTLALHWDGSAWTVSPTPTIAGRDTRLLGVKAISLNDAWAVGYSYAGSAGWYQLLARWKGGHWALDSVTSPGHDSQLFAVDALAAEDVWAAGTYGLDFTFGLAEHYVSSCTAPSPSPTPTSTPCHINFSDVHPGDYFYDAVRSLYCSGVISGYADNTFRPYNNTTRGQICKIVILAEGWMLYAPSTPSFSDVPVNHPFYAYIETAALNGVVSGYAGGTFAPYNDVTRGQLAKIIANAAGWPDYSPPTPTFVDVPIYNPFYGYIETAYHEGIISGYSCGAGCLEFRPGNNATRGQISKMVYGAMQKSARPGKVLRPLDSSR